LSHNIAHLEKKGFAQFVKHGTECLSAESVQEMARASIDDEDEDDEEDYD
jgi:hypothetical protein